MIPYDAQMVAILLRRMPDYRLRVTKPADFHRWPAPKITKTAVIAEMIAAEKARRS